MSDVQNATANGRPWHLWVVGILMVLWNSIGCLDFVMVQLRNTGYLEAAEFSEAQMDFFYAYPRWAVLIWGIAVWSAMLGAILLLAKKRLAVNAYTAGLLAYVLAMIRQYGFTDFTELFTKPSYKVMAVVIFVLAVMQLLYARAMARRGVLT